MAPVFAFESGGFTRSRSCEYSLVRPRRPQSQSGCRLESAPGASRREQPCRLPRPLRSLSNASIRMVHVLGDPRRAACHLARIARRARSHYRRETIGTNVAVFLSLATRAQRPYRTAHECRSRALHERTGSPHNFLFGLSSVRSVRRTTRAPELSSHNGGRPNTRCITTRWRHSWLPDHSASKLCRGDFHSVVPRLAAGRRRARRCGPSAARDLPSCHERHSCPAAMFPAYPLTWPPPARSICYASV